MVELAKLPEGFFWRVKTTNDEPGHVRLFLMRERKGRRRAKTIGYAPYPYGSGFHYSKLPSVSATIWNEYQEERVAEGLGGNYPPKVWSER